MKKKRKIDKYKVITLSALAIVSGSVIWNVSANMYNNREKEIDYKYAFLVTPVYNKLPIKSRIVFLDANGNEIHEKKIGNIDVTTFIKEGNDIKFLGNSSNKTFTLDTATNKLDIKKVKTCDGYVEDILDTKSGKAYIFSENVMSSHIYLNEKCYTMPNYISNYYYDLNQNTIGVTGYNSKGEYQYHKFNLDTKKIDKIEIKEELPFEKLEKTNGMIKDNYFYTVENAIDKREKDNKNYKSTIFLNKYDATNLKLEKQTEVKKIPRIGNDSENNISRENLSIYTNEHIYINDLKNKKFVYRLYDLNLNLVKTYNMTYNNENIVPMEAPEKHGNKLIFRANYKNNIYIFHYNLTDEKYEKAIKTKISYSGFVNETSKDFIIN